MIAWNTSTGREVAVDRDYSDISTELAFDGTSRMATVSYDGFIRLYDPDFRLRAKVRVPGGCKPHSVAFAPDDWSLVAGYVDALRVDVLVGPQS